MRIVRWGLAGLGLVVAAIVVVGALGVGFSASAEEGRRLLSNRYIEILAGKLGITSEELRLKMDAAREEAVNEAIASGQITPDQGERLRDGAAGLGVLRMRGGNLLLGVHHLNETAASIIGIDPAALRQELVNGKTLAQVAADHGVSRDALKAGIVKEAEAMATQAVSTHKITEDQKTRLLSELNGRIDALLDGTLLLKGERIGPLGGGR